MKLKQKKRLIESLRIRIKQFEAGFNGKTMTYPLNSGHHARDVLTTLAVLEGRDDADTLLAHMPKED